MKGGYFICTYPDSNVIVKKLRSTNSEYKQGYNIVENKYYSIIMNKIEYKIQKVKVIIQEKVLYSTKLICLPLLNVPFVSLSNPLPVLI